LVYTLRSDRFLGKPLAPSEGEGNSGRGQNSPVDKWLEKTSPGASERRKRPQPFPQSLPHVNTFERFRNFRCR